MKIKLLAGFWFWFLVFENTAFAQKENYVWYFGNYAGLDFNSGNPVALTNGALLTQEGCASISDANGNIVFYTSGITVYDRNHTAMPNGLGLFGGNSSTQSALIVPFPGNNNLFYIFTVAETSPSEFCYSIVDMTLNNGNGDVTVKNFLIKTFVAEKLCGVKHSNNTDIWVMVRSFPFDTLFAYPVTASGISLTPVTTKIGPSGTGYDYRGYMKFSPDGTKLANAVFESNYVDLFDFDASTGIVSNEKYLTLPPANGAQGAQGVEFSLSGQYLYAAQQEPSHIFQWDISSNNVTTINATLIQIGSSSVLNLGAIQMAPDGKIYVAEYNTGFLGVINSPDLPGLSCNYIDNALSLSGQTCRLGLPNFIASYFLPTGINTNNPQQNQLTISPNPATDHIYISFPATASETITIKIFSTTGEVIYEQKNKSSVSISNFQLPITNLSNGIYFAGVQTEKEFITKKIVVQY